MEGAARETPTKSEKQMTIDFTDPTYTDAIVFVNNKRVSGAIRANIEEGWVEIVKSPEDIPLDTSQSSPIKEGDIPGAHLDVDAFRLAGKVEIIIPNVRQGTYSRITTNERQQ